MSKWMYLLLCAPPAVSAQSAKEYDFHLDNGAEVMYQTFAELNPKNPAPSLGTATSGGNAIVRNVADGKSAGPLGFELHIEKISGDPIRFRVSMTPMDKSAFFLQAAPSREIHNGDRVLLEVMRDPRSGKGIFDSFQVGIGVGLHSMPVAKTIPHALAAGAVIHLQTPQLFQGQTELGDNASVLNGTVLSLHIAGKPAFSFSTHPESGFRMEAIAEGNVLMFVSGSESYQLQCTAPVIDSTGAWYLWVRRDTPGAPSNLPALNLVAP